MAFFFAIPIFLAPYTCMTGKRIPKYFTCLAFPWLTNVSRLVEETKSYEKAGLIDPLSNLQRQRVFIFAGYLDLIAVNFRGKAFMYHQSIFNETRGSL